MPTFTLDGIEHDFTPVKDFRAAHQLPADFGVGTFAPKDYTGLGRIDRAGSDLNAVREAVLAALPATIAAPNWLNVLPDLGRLFEEQLYGINPQVGLKAVEIEYAVSGFNDVCQAVAYALVRARAAHTPPPDFRAIYGDWLNGTLKVMAEPYAYEHEGQRWTIQLVAHAYGRMGLRIQVGERIYAVYDPALACPAEGFMTAMLGEVTARMTAATR